MPNFFNKLLFFFKKRTKIFKTIFIKGNVLIQYILLWPKLSVFSGDKKFRCLTLILTVNYFFDQSNLTCFYNNYIIYIIRNCQKVLKQIRFIFSNLRKKNAKSKKMRTKPNWIMI